MTIAEANVRRNARKLNCVLIIFVLPFAFKFKSFALTSKNIGDILNDSIKWN